MFGLGLIIPCYWDESLLCTLLIASLILKFSSLAGGNRQRSQPCVSIRHRHAFSNPFEWFFPLSWAVSLPHGLISSQLNASRGGFCTSPSFSLCAAFSFPVLCPDNPPALVYPDSQLPLLNSGLCLGSTSLCLGTLSRPLAGSTTRFTFFVSHLSKITVLHCLLSNIFLKNCFLHFGSYLVVSCGRVSLVPPKNWKKLLNSTTSAPRILDKGFVDPYIIRTIILTGSRYK